MTKEQLSGDYKTYQELPLTPITSVDSATNQTGFWKTFKPTLDESKCIKCTICWKFCPDVAIKITPNEEIGVFEQELVGSSVVVTGIVKELRIDEAYVANIENEADDVTKSKDKHE